MYKYETVGSAIDRFMAGQSPILDDLSKENRELFKKLVKVIIENSPRRSARLK